MCSLLLIQLAGQITAGRRKELKKKNRKAEEKHIHPTQWSTALASIRWCRTLRDWERKTKKDQSFGEQLLCVNNINSGRNRRNKCEGFFPVLWEPTLYLPPLPHIFLISAAKYLHYFKFFFYLSWWWENIGHIVPTFARVIFSTLFSKLDVPKPSWNRVCTFFFHLLPYIWSRVCFDAQVYQHKIIGRRRERSKSGWIQGVMILRKHPNTGRTVCQSTELRLWV